MKINKIIVLNGGLDDFSYSVGESGVNQIREFNSNGRNYFSVEFENNEIIDVYATNVIVYRGVA